MSFYNELKQHNIFRMGLAYLVGSWLVVQTLVMLTPIFDLPLILARGFVFMLIPGFPIILLLTWVFDLTHKNENFGVKKEVEEKPDVVTFDVFTVVILSIVGLALVILLVDIFLID